MTVTQTSLTLRTAREKFITALEADGLSPNTIREYCRVTGQLLAFFGDISPAELSPDDLRRFLADYRRSRSPKTVYNAWVVLRSFWRYLEEHRYPNIARSLRAPRYPRPATRLLTPQDIRSLLKACEYTAPSKDKRKPFRMPRPTARRDKALVRFPNPKALVAYAGLDVTLHQSGCFQGRRRLSKRGDPLPRHVLYLMAVTLTRHTRRFTQAFTHYRQKGRAVRKIFVILSVRRRFLA